MGRPLFSVVMATFDRGDHIVPSLRSVLRQTVDDFELLVVNDGPLGRTAKRHLACRKVKWLDLPRHTACQSEPNNRGLSAARGRWIAYIGHDDIWSSVHLETLARAIARAPSPDVVIGGCLYHGPPGCGVVSVNGLFEDESAKFEHFFPPSSVAHRRGVLKRIGKWRDPRTTAAPVDADFLLRMAEAGLRFVSTNRITVHKFAAGHRYLSYLDPQSREQQAALDDARFDTPAAWDDEVSAARVDGRHAAMRYPDYSKARPGAAYFANRSNKGIDRPPLRALTQPVTIAQTPEPRGLDWHALEAAEIPFRWSGPSPRPKILIPFTYDGAARISLRVVASHSRLEDVELSLAARPLPLTIAETDTGILLVTEVALHPSCYTILDLHTPNMETPCKVQDSIDARRLGLALADISLEPLPPESAGGHGY